MQASIDRLTGQHRELEALAEELTPALSAIAKGRPAQCDADTVERLVAAYRAHAAYEEQVYLPLAQQILERQGGELSKLAVRLHLRKPSIRNIMYFNGST